jgi:hypothetical protein
MKRFLFRLSIAIAAFAIGVTVASIYRRDAIETTNSPAVRIAEVRFRNDCYPGRSTENAPRHGRRMSEWYSKHLRAMAEAPLYAADNAEQETYRFLWLRSFHHPVAVRIWKSGTDHFISLKELSGAGGYEPGNIIFAEQRRLAPAEWDGFTRLLRSSCYWELPSENPDEIGFDGAQWILEGVRGGRYHIVDRWTPTSGSFREVCLYALKLSGLKIDTKTEPLY